MAYEDPASIRPIGESAGRRDCVQDREARRVWIGPRTLNLSQDEEGTIVRDLDAHIGLADIGEQLLAQSVGELGNGQPRGGHIADQRVGDRSL